MNITGLVVEYNPFHNGHLHHLNESRRKTNADLVIAVMSGNFLQRGEPALVSKWARSKMALASGVDIVVELPYVYATQHAEIFATGAVSLLDSIGATNLCFGSESGNINEFHKLVTFLHDQQLNYNEFLKEELKKGVSYPTALSNSFKKLHKKEDILDLAEPNNILGYHYMKAIRELKSSINAVTIQRTTANYHDKAITSASIASATSIRHSLMKANQNLNDIKHVIPQTTLIELEQFFSDYCTFVSWNNLFPFLKYKILSSHPTELNSVYEAEEGLENRVINEIGNTVNFAEFMEKLKTKRYTWTRLQRLCLHILTNTKKTEMSFLDRKAPYIRILGMNEEGRNYLNGMKKKIDVPLVTTISKFQHPFLEIEKRASFCYSLAFTKNIQPVIAKQEFSQPPILYRNKSL